MAFISKNWKIKLFHSFFGECIIQGWAVYLQASLQLQWRSRETPWKQHPLVAKTTHSSTFQRNKLASSCKQCADENLTFEIEQHHREAALCNFGVEVVRGQLGDWVHVLQVSSVSIDLRSDFVIQICCWHTFTKIFSPNFSLSVPLALVWILWGSIY